MIKGIIDEIYSIARDLTPLKKHTVIITITSIFDKFFTLNTSIDIYYKDAVKFNYTSSEIKKMLPSSAVIKSVMQEINSMEEMELTDEILKKFEYYYIILKLDKHFVDCRTLCDMFPEKFFNSLDKTNLTFNSIIPRYITDSFICEMSEYVKSGKSFIDFCTECEAKYNIVGFKLLLHKLFNKVCENDFRIRLMFPVLVALDDYYKLGYYKSPYEVINSRNFSYKIFESYKGKNIKYVEDIIKLIDSTDLNHDNLLKCIGDYKNALNYLVKSKDIINYELLDYMEKYISNHLILRKHKKKLSVYEITKFMSLCGYCYSYIYEYNNADRAYEELDKLKSNKGNPTTAYKGFGGFVLFSKTICSLLHNPKLLNIVKLINPTSDLIDKIEEFNKLECPTFSAFCSKENTEYDYEKLKNDYEHDKYEDGEERYAILINWLSLENKDLTKLIKMHGKYPLRYAWYSVLSESEKHLIKSMTTDFNFYNLNAAGDIYSDCLKDANRNIIYTIEKFKTIAGYSTFDYADFDRLGKVQRL